MKLFVKTHVLLLPVPKAALRNWTLCIAALMAALPALATRITGTVTDPKGQPLAYASILIKGTTRGTTAGAQGKYFIDVEPGTYTVVAQYVGYERQEKKVTVGAQSIELNFTLSPQQLSMKEVIVRPGGEDPAYEIIRNAIRKRKDYRAPLDSFTCEAYIKTLVRTTKLPKKIAGEKIEDADRKQMNLDSTGKGVIYLSESLTKISFKKPGKLKLEVISGRESGSNGFGFSFPTFINFYENNVFVFTSQLNPRGFISPIADAALNYYKYHYEGSFFEEGKEINRIKVTPRRTYEPLFSGTINIVDGEWRIHSLDLMLTQQSQLELLDTLTIKQVHEPITPGIWQTKDQVVAFTFNAFGVGLSGNFLNVYNKYNIDPGFGKRYFNNVVVKYDTAVNKRSRAYWDSIRPVQLAPEEIKDYAFKDSAYKRRVDSAGSRSNIDSLRKRQGHVQVSQLLSTGFTRSNFHKYPFTYSWKPLFRGIEYNTVEGVAVNAEGTLQKALPSRQRISLTLHVRYGFSNDHLNAWATLQYSKRSFTWDEEGGSSGRYTWTLGGGKRVSQFNEQDPVNVKLNSLYTLLLRRNYLKIYENYYGYLGYNRNFDNGLVMGAGVLYEDRMPIGNTTDYSLIKSSGRLFTPNYPFEKIDSQFTRHQAVILSARILFQPGQKFVEFPRNRVAIGSKYPVFELQYQKGIPDVAGSDVDFDKWSFSVSDDVNFRLRGDLKYRLLIGGFINTRSVFIQDYQHFNGNQFIVAAPYLNSFQVAPYYANSTTASFYATAHLEHHFNGFLTNKIPLFKKLKWNLVGGTNSFYVNRANNYVEAFAGLENILKIFRVDVVGAYLDGRKGQTAIRIGLGGIIGSSIRSNR